MSMWWSHIQSAPKLPALRGAEGTEIIDPTAGGTGAGAEGTPPAQPEVPAAGSEVHEGDPQKKIRAQEEIIERLSRQREERDGELEELRKYREQAENEKLSADEIQQKQFKELSEQRDALEMENKTLRESMQKLAIKNAFLSSSDVAWHNPERALALADLSEVEVVFGTDGIATVKEPSKLTAKMKALAESDPYLVKTDSGTDNVWKGKTGEASPRRKQSDQVSEEQRLRRKYPALRR